LIFLYSGCNVEHNLSLNSRIALGLNRNRTTKSVASATLFVYDIWGLGGLVCGVVKGAVVGGSKTPSAEGVKLSLSVKLRRRKA